MMQNSKLSVLFKLLVLFISLASFGAWFLQSIAGWVFTLICGVLMALISVSHRYFSITKKNTTWFVLLTLATLLTCVHMNTNGYIAALIGLLPIYIIIGLRNELKEELFYFIKKTFGVMILISLAWYILFLLKVPLPSYDIILETSDVNIQYHYTIFYLFTLKTDADLLSFLLPRFEFVFYEPGYFGCLMAVMLFLGGYKFNRVNWENYVFLLALLLSFSLAGVAIGLFGFIAYSIEHSMHKARWLVLSAILFGGFYIAVTNYNQGDNLINNALFSRLEYDDYKGDIAGNTRFSEYVSDYFWMKFVQSKDIWFGLKNPDNVLTNNNVDYLSYTIRFGIFALFAALAFFFYPATKERNNRYSVLSLSIIYILVFAQGSFSAFWTFNLVLLILGMNRLQMNYS